MKININESGISFNRDSGGSAVLDESILKEIEERLKNINDKVEYSDKIPTDEDIVIWINPEEDPAQEYLIRINDETVASNTVWSSEKVYQQINNMFIQSDSHIHFNKDVLDKITERDIANWNSKSNFDGSYKSLTDKPAIPSVEGLASEEYVNEAIENLQLPPNLATKEDIPTNVSELENDSNYITDTELEEELDSKGYLTEHQDLSEYAKTKDIPTKISELENDNNYAMLSQIHQHENKDILDGITSGQIEKWDSYTEFDGDYNSLVNKPYIPKSTNDLVNDSGFISEIPSEYITEYKLLQKNYAKKENLPTKLSDLQNDSGFISEIPNEYITETELENTINNIEKIVSSDIQPVDNNVTLWVNTSEDETTTVTRINDETVASNTTWSSEKIFEQYNELLEKYNSLLKRVMVLEGLEDDSEGEDNPNLKEVALVGEGKVDQCVVE